MGRIIVEKKKCHDIGFGNNSTEIAYWRSRLAYVGAGEITVKSTVASLQYNTRTCNTLLPPNS